MRYSTDGSALDPLSRISLEFILRKLPESDRDLLILRYGVAAPHAYKGQWPPTTESIAHYIGIRFGRGPLSRSQVYRRIKAALGKARTIAFGGGI